MTFDPSNWQTSAEYDYAEDLTASDLAWEWLRRNERYVHDFDALMSADTEVQTLMSSIRQQWRLLLSARSAKCFH